MRKMQDTWQRHPQAGMAEPKQARGVTRATGVGDRPFSPSLEQELSLQIRNPAL